MPYRFTDWPYLLRSKPDIAAQRLMAAYRQAGGNARAAAGALGISEPSFYRYAKRLHLKLIRAQVKGPPPQKRRRPAIKRT